MYMIFVIGLYLPNVISMVDGRVLLSYIVATRYLGEQYSMSYINGNTPGTTFTAFGEFRDNISIALMDEKENVLTEFTPKVWKTWINNFFMVTVSTEGSGFRIYEHGEENTFFTCNMTRVKRIGITTPGISRAFLAYNEPEWAIKGAETNIKVHNYEPSGKQVPLSHELLDFNSAELRVGDWIVVVGEMMHSKLVQIRLDAGDKTPLYMKIRSEGEPFMELGTIIKDYAGSNITYIDTVETRDNVITGRFTIALVCAHFGWKIYINGDYHHLFQHRYSYSKIKMLSLSGQDLQASDWKVLQVIRQHT